LSLGVVIQETQDFDRRALSRLFDQNLRDLLRSGTGAQNQDVFHAFLPAGGDLGYYGTVP
jgi:hypothetical protein